MAIDLFSESLITLEQATEFWPVKVTPQTVRNWINKGTTVTCPDGKRRTVLLDGCPFGNKLGTSKEALQRFSMNLLVARRAQGQALSRAKDPTKQIAADELRAAGYMD